MAVLFRRVSAMVFALVMGVWFSFIGPGRRGQSVSSGRSSENGSAQHNKKHSDRRKPLAFHRVTPHF